ncbi:hypothetical protein ATO2_02525 [Roseovarius sp. 22II1-1F6A]|nr:hypothetical protein ATO2_02525 [Roseovarius sp. 22II1-1F6A]
MWHHRGGRIGLICLTFMVSVAVFAPVLAPYGPNEQLSGSELMGMSAEHWFGTDLLGRDILSRTIYASRVSLTAGALAVLLGAVIGTFIGLVAGTLGGWADSSLMRLSDSISAFPAILLGAAIVAILGPGFLQVAVAIAIAQSPLFARLARAIAMSEARLEYIEAAESMGASKARIIFRHILPNAAGPLVVQASLSVGIAILMESGLSFLGLGVQPPTPSWGQMLSDSLRFLDFVPVYAVVPGAALTIVLVGINLVADALRDKLDPQSKQKAGS